jgi:hypothetical protein
MRIGLLTSDRLVTARASGLASGAARRTIREHPCQQLLAETQGEKTEDEAKHSEDGSHLDRSARLFSSETAVV